MKIPQYPMAALINATLVRVISPLQIHLIHEAVFYHGFKPPRLLFGNRGKLSWFVLYEGYFIYL